jgi:hypothetical protein
MAMKAVRIHEFGGPDVLKFEDIPAPNPSEGETRIRVVAADLALNPSNPESMPLPRHLRCTARMPSTQWSGLHGRLNCQQVSDLSRLRPSRPPGWRRDSLCSSTAL